MLKPHLGKARADRFHQCVRGGFLGLGAKVARSQWHVWEEVIGSGIGNTFRTIWTHSLPRFSEHIRLQDQDKNRRTWVVSINDLLFPCDYRIIFNSNRLSRIQVPAHASWMSDVDSFSIDAAWWSSGPQIKNTGGIFRMFSRMNPINPGIT